MPKQEMSSVDVLATARELADRLIGARVDKAFQPSREEILLRVRAKAEAEGETGSRRDLIIGTGKYAFITAVPRENPQTPPAFAMSLRKHVGNGRVLDVRQHGFDRVLEFDIGRKEGLSTVIVELFSDGNVILVQHGRIVSSLLRQSWATREVRAGADFEHAPGGVNARTLDEESFLRTFRASDSDAVRTLATHVGLGPQWAEEVVLRAGIPKHKPVSEITDDEARSLHGTLRSILERIEFGDLDPVVVLDDDGEPIDANPIPLAQHEGRQMERFKTFQEALDRYFSKDIEVKPQEDPRLRRMRDERDRFDRRLAQMETAIAKFVKEEEESRIRGDLVYAHFDQCDKTLRTILEASREKGWKEVQERVKEARKAGLPEVQHIEAFSPSEGTLTLILPGYDGKPVRLRLDVRKSVQDNAQIYYERAKKMKDKREGAVRAMEETRNKLKDLGQEGDKLLARLERDAKKAPPTKRFWFEGYRWFRTSDNFLVLAGRDAGTNEKLVKKHLDDVDRYVHAEVSGAPSAVVKTGGAEPSEATLEEACQFAVAMSKAWTSGYGASDAYWVMPAQVSKTPQAGEFLGRGAFIVRGKRNYVTCPVLAAVGEVMEEGHRKVMGGPVRAVTARAKRYVVFAPGNTGKNVVANRLAELFSVPVEEIQAVLPPGDVRVVEARGLEL